MLITDLVELAQWYEKVNNENNLLFSEELSLFNQSLNSFCVFFLLLHWYCVCCVISFFLLNHLALTWCEFLKLCPIIIRIELKNVLSTRSSMICYQYFLHKILAMWVFSIIKYMQIVWLALSCCTTCICLLLNHLVKDALFKERHILIIEDFNIRMQGFINQ